MWPGRPAIAARASRLADRPKDSLCNPHREAILRIVGAVQAALAEQTDEWAEGRRYLGLDVLARSRMRLVPTIEGEVNTDTIMALSA